MRSNLSSFAAVGAFSLMLGLASVSFGQAAAAPAAGSPAGTWTWSQPGRGGDQQISLVLKQDGDKITGTLTANDRETEISDASFKDGTLTFKVTRENNGNKMITTYTGTIEGDSFKAKSEQSSTREITATRSK